MSTTQFSDVNLVSSSNSISCLDDLGSRFSKQIFPKTMEEVFQWSMYLYERQGLFTESLKQAVRYFMTEYELKGSGLGAEEGKSYKQMLDDLVDIVGEATLVGDDFVFTGNVFTSMYFPFDKELICPRCGARAPLRRVYPSTNMKWDPKTGKFSGACWGNARYACHYSGKMELDEINRSGDRLKPRVLRWPPQLVGLTAHPMSGNKRFVIRVNEWSWLADGVKSGDPLFLEDTPQEFIEAIVADRPLRMYDNMVYHLANESLSLGIPAYRGWGLPRFMAEFDTVVLLAMLDRYNEAICQEYLIPFRILALPGANQGNNSQSSLNIFNNINVSDFKAKVEVMLQEHKRNPTGYNILPSPLEYQVLGGEAKNLIPLEIMQHYELRLLRSMGVLSEMYSGDSISPDDLVKFLLFERSWQEITRALNKWCTWVASEVGRLKNLPKTKAALIPVSVYTNQVTRQTILELSTSGRISQTTGLEILGLDREREQDRMELEQIADTERADRLNQMMEDRQITQEALRTPAPGEQELMEEQQAEQQQAGGAPAGAPVPAAPGGMMPGAAPMGGAPIQLPPNPSLEQLEATADQEAQRLMTLPPEQRRNELVNYSYNNATLHSMIKGNLEKMETQAEAQGRAMARQGQM